MAVNVVRYEFRGRIQWGVIREADHAHPRRLSDHEGIHHGQLGQRSHPAAGRRGECLRCDDPLAGDTEPAVPLPGQTIAST